MVSQSGKSTLLLGAGIALMVAMAPAASASAAESGYSGPTVTATTSNPADGTIMPKFQTQSLRAQAGGTEGSYSVTIDSAPTAVQSGDQFTIQAHSTGFAAGNWVNVWTRLPDGTQLDAGGRVEQNDTFSIPVRLVAPGTTQVQLSIGTWPSEQWSQAVKVDVAPPPVGGAQAAVYDNLSGVPVIVATSNVASQVGANAADHEFVYYRYGAGGASHMASRNFPVGPTPTVQTTQTTTPASSRESVAKPVPGTAVAVSMAWCSGPGCLA